jgi:predicted lactoylglutathione lyase|tara:strand:- start:932 stop:1060 length:129 start_codon:yes stop_codon:yes gene_type:complete
VEATFEKSQVQDTSQSAKTLAALSKFTDEKVDGMRKQKDEEL